MPYELVQQYWLAWVVMLSPRALTTTSESGNSRRAAMDNGESARPMERACTMSSSVARLESDRTESDQQGATAGGATRALGAGWLEWRKITTPSGREFGPYVYY